MLLRPGSSWGCGALLKGTSVVVLKVEESAVHSLPVAAPDRKFRWGRLFCKLYILISEHKILAEMSLHYPVGGTLMLIDRLEVMLHT